VSLRGRAAALLLLWVLLPAGAGAEPFPSPEQEKDLGWFHANEQSDFFVRVSTARPRGVLRIGVFGESNVAGIGVGDGEAFPALLEAEFRSRGIRNVQVVSFAVGGYGAHQAHMLWRYAAQDYGLDVIVFCFWPFLPERDTAFLAPWSQQQTGSQELHARYVVAEGGLRRVSIPGPTRLASVRRYWSWIPNWTDARYSRQTPLFIRRLLPKRRQLVGNPFYYDRGRDLEAEALETYRLILRDLSRSGKAVVAWYDPRPWGEDFRRTALAGQEPNVVGLASLGVSEGNGAGVRSLLRASDGHISAVTQRNIARELFAVLTGAESVEFESYRWAPPAKGAVQPAPPSCAALRDCGPVRTTLGGREILRLQPVSPKKTDGFDPRSADAASLLIVEAKQPLFYVLDSRLHAKSSLGIRLSVGGEELSIPLGPIEMLAPVLGRVRIPERTLEARLSRGDRLTLEFAAGSSPHICWRLAPDRKVKRAALVVDGRGLLENLEFRDAKGIRGLCGARDRTRAGVLRLIPGAYASLQDLAKVSAPLELVAGEPEQGWRLPLGALAQVKRRVPIPRLSRPPLLLRSGPSGLKEAVFRTP